MAVPWHITFSAWLPFPIVALIGFFCATMYYIHFTSKFKLFPAFVGVTTVVLSMLVVILIPIDVFLVSSTKAQNGSRYDWANNSTMYQLENTVLVGYYALYGLMLLVIFLLLPFAYFSYPPSVGEDEASRDSKKAVARGVKFTFLSFLLLCLLLVIGIVVPMGDLPYHNSTMYYQMNYLSEFDCTKDIAENGLTFVINSLGLIGMICSMIYTAYGMAILPINMIKGKPRETRQRQQMESSIEALMAKIEDLSGQPSHEQPLGEVDRKLLTRYSMQLSELQSRCDTMRHQSYSSIAWCKHVLRPFEIAMGVILFLFSLLIVADISLSNINRSISSMGMHAGYMINRTVIFNPINALLLLCNQVFPLDYVVLGGIILYFTISSLSGMQHMGIWFFWRKLHVLRAGRSSVQALLFSAFVLATVTLYSGVLAYTLAPQYVTYGTQMYRLHIPLAASKTGLPQHQMTDIVTAPCSLYAPADQCTMTRLMTFQSRLFYRMWFFGVAYFWSTWLFVLIFIVGSIVSIVRLRKTVAQIMMRNNREDEESLERLI